MVIPNNKNVENLTDKFSYFILPVEGLSIGFDVYFNLNEVKELSKKYKIYVIINRFFHCEILDEVKNILNDLDSVLGFFVEDLGIASFLPKDKVILFQNHITSSYANINALNGLDYKNVVVSNELTINELKEIRNKCESKLYYFLVNRNMLMYSRRTLVSNYFNYYGYNQNSNSYFMDEVVSKNKLLFKEEFGSTCVFWGNIFCGNKYLDEFNMDYYIINLNNINDSYSKIIIDNYDKVDLYKLFDCDYYFLENKIQYKVKNNE